MATTYADDGRRADTGQAAIHPPDCTHAADDAHHCPPPARRLVLVVAVLASALGFIDSTVVSIAIPAIRESLGASLGAATWVQNGYLLSLSAFILVGGAAGDRFGVRNTFIAGIVAFALTSVLCAVAWSPEVLIGARFLKGAAAAFTVPLSLALIAKNYPGETRGRAIGIWAAASGITTAIGPVAGGWLLSVGGPESWRWIFWINPPAAAAIVFLLMRVPADAARANERLDLTGAAIAAAALGLMAYGLTTLGRADNGTALPLAVLGAGIAAFAAFVWWEGRAPNPMVELPLFANRAFAGANVLTFLVYFALSGVMFFLPMTLVSGWGLTEAAVGTVFLPFTAVMAVLSGFSGDYAGRHGPKLPIALGAAVVAVAFAWLGATAGTRSLAVSIYPAMAILGVGMGLAVSPLSTAIMGAVPGEHSGEASGINNAVSRMAGLFAVAGLGVLVSLVFQSGDVPDGASFGEAVDELTAARVADATDRAFAALAYTCAALAAAGAVVAWITQDGTGTAAGTTAGTARASKG